jgi:hypothetical protein
MLGLVVVPDDVCYDPAEVMSIKERTVRLTLHYDKDTFVVDDQCIIDALKLIVDTHDIQCLGTLKRRLEFHVTFRTYENVKDLLSIERLTIRRGSKVRYADVSALQPKDVQVRVLWAPCYISDDAIISMLEQLSGGMVTRLIRKTEQMAEFARYDKTEFMVELQNCWPHSFPEHVTMSHLDEKVSLLLLVKGRPQACWMCGGLDHGQRECLHPTCRYCRREGHLLSDCPKLREAEEKKAAETTAREEAEKQRDDVLDTISGMFHQPPPQARNEENNRPEQDDVEESEEEGEFEEVLEERTDQDGDKDTAMEEVPAAEPVAAANGSGEKVQPSTTQTLVDSVDALLEGIAPTPVKVSPSPAKGKSSAVGKSPTTPRGYAAAAAKLVSDPGFLPPRTRTTPNRIPTGTKPVHLSPGAGRGRGLPPSSLPRFHNTPLPSSANRRRKMEEEQESQKNLKKKNT